MKIYIAGKLGSKNELESIENIAKICEEMGFKTFVPHRDVGIAKSFHDADKIFKGDIIEGFKDVKLVVAILDGLHIGAGTSWELGYSYAKKIPCIGIKTDEPIEDAFEYLSSILIASMKIVTSIDELKKELEKYR
jgi:nucleoside 2-deoxyribosyltransferase